MYFNYWLLLFKLLVLLGGVKGGELIICRGGNAAKQSNKPCLSTAHTLGRAGLRSIPAAGAGPGWTTSRGLSTAVLQPQPIADRNTSGMGACGGRGGAAGGGLAPRRVRAEQK